MSHFWHTFLLFFFKCSLKCSFVFRKCSSSQLSGNFLKICYVKCRSVWVGVCLWLQKPTYHQAVPFRRQAEQWFTTYIMQNIIISLQQTFSKSHVMCISRKCLQMLANHFNFLAFAHTFMQRCFIDQIKEQRRTYFLMDNMIIWGIYIQSGLFSYNWTPLSVLFLSHHHHLPKNYIYKLKNDTVSNNFLHLYIRLRSWHVHEAS